MHALEDLYNEVRDPATKPRVPEAIDAYNAGAFRSAIISTWVAVSLDLVAKIRELADQGDSAAVAWRDTLDAAITASNKQQLQKIEADLLDDAKTQFSFINEREHIELSRLLDDRHVCAHPALVDVNKVLALRPNWSGSTCRPQSPPSSRSPQPPGGRPLSDFSQRARRRHGRVPAPIWPLTCGTTTWIAASSHSARTWHR